MQFFTDHNGVGEIVSFSFWLLSVLAFGSSNPENLCFAVNYLEQVRLHQRPNLSSAGLMRGSRIPHEEGIIFIKGDT